MNKQTTTITSSKIKSIFAVIEEKSGTLQKPTPESFIQPAGDPAMTQTPGYTDSEELSGTLDVMEQFPNAMEAGEATVPMYARLDKDGRLQGHDLFCALMGRVQERNTVTARANVAALASLESTDSEDHLTPQNIAATATEIPVKEISGGFLPRRGVVSVGAEKIRYTDVREDEQGNVTALVSCTRGFAGTGPDAIADNAQITLTSLVYHFDNSRPTVSLWMKTAHAVFFARGATVTQCQIPMSKTGGQHVDFTLSFAQMGWAGKSTLSSAPSDGSLAVVLEDKTPATDAYSVGAYIKNATQNDDNSGQGYEITAIDGERGTITVSPAPTGWQKNDAIEPWLPAGAARGTALAASELRAFVGGKAGKLTEGSITIGTPAVYSSEIGQEWPGESADNTRQMTMDNGLYFRARDIVEFKRGYEGYDARVDVVMGGKAGLCLALAMPRVKFQAPAMATEDAFVTLTRTGAIMGTKGNDSLYIIQE